MIQRKPSNRRPLPLSLLLVLMLLPVQMPAADELIMRDGSRLIGEVLHRK